MPTERHLMKCQVDVLMNSEGVLKRMFQLAFHPVSPWSLSLSDIKITLLQKYAWMPARELRLDPTSIRSHCLMVFTLGVSLKETKRIYLSNLWDSEHNFINRESIIFLDRWLCWWKCLLWYCKCFGGDQWCRVCNWYVQSILVVLSWIISFATVTVGNGSADSWDLFFSTGPMGCLGQCLACGLWNMACLFWGNRTSLLWSVCGCICHCSLWTTFNKLCWLLQPLIRNGIFNIWDIRTAF